MDTGAENYRRYLNGEDEGLVELIRDYQEGLTLFLNRYVRNLHTAEDLAEETFFRLVTKKPRFTPRYSFKTWLYAIGRNTALSYLRRCHEEVPEEALEQLHRKEEELECQYLREEQRRMVHRALGRLREDYGMVLYLKFFEELNNEDCAKVMKRSRRQIENLAYQAKRALKTELEQEGFIYEGLS